MRTHPVFVRLEGRRCVIVGGDAAAAAKVIACLAAGGEVVVVAPEVTLELRSLAAAGRIRWLGREYGPGDLAGAFLVYASTRDAGTVRRLVTEASAERALLNVLDTPEACSFISPAVVERGDLQIAVGTGGASPGLSARLRRELELVVGPEYGPFVAILGAVRQALAHDPARVERRGTVLAELLASPLLELVREGREREIDALLAGIAGEGCTLERLGVSMTADGG